MSLSELIVIFIVALILFGPEKLPELARTFGRLAGQAKRTTESVRREFYNNIYPPTPEQPFTQVRQDLRSVTDEVKSLLHEVKSPLSSPPTEVKKD